MKLLYNFFSSLVFSFLLFSCSKDSTVVEVSDNLSLSILTEFSANEESQTIAVTSNLNWTVVNDLSWLSILPPSGSNNGTIFVSAEENTSYSERSGKITIKGGSISKVITIEQSGKENNGSSNGLDPNKAPSENFNLSTWKLNTPENNGNNLSKTISVTDINNGYQNSNYFYTADDGGMVFKCPVNGYKTSANTSYTRVELREMLRGTNTSINTQGVNKNNWVFGTAPEADKVAAAGFDGEMNATLAVNHVTTTGESGHIGRVIIGQIHANNDEPIRIYY
ncbi:MAG: polysaccharide lyase family 7 protein, partial [Polaribacter sp.]